MLPFEHRQLLAQWRDSQSAISAASETSEQRRRPKAAQFQTWHELLAECAAEDFSQVVEFRVVNILSNDRLEVHDPGTSERVV
jgi:hypothetical protein